MANEIVTRQEQTPRLYRFDSSILAGTVSPGTFQQYVGLFAAYLDYAGDFRLAMDPSTLARWRHHLFNEPYAFKDGKAQYYTVASINLRLAAVRTMVRVAAENGYVPKYLVDEFVQVRGVKQNQARTRLKPHARVRITKKEMQRILEQPDETTLSGAMHKALLYTLSGSGLRISEALRLKMDDIEYGTDGDGNAGYVVQVITKGRTHPEPRPMSVAAVAAINHWIDMRPVYSQYIFTKVGGRGRHVLGVEPITPQGAWWIVRRYCHMAGIAHAKPHDFRRYVGTQLARRDIRLAQKALGHKRIETTVQHYVLDELKRGITDDLV